jgi:branched-subunit amino acid transport protein
MFLNDGVLNLSPGNARLLSGLLAIFIAWRTKNVTLTIVVGMLALWILQALIG